MEWGAAEALWPRVLAANARFTEDLCLADPKDTDNMTTQPGSHHDWDSPEYVAEWIEARREEDGERAERFRFVAKLVPFASSDEINILDLGGGYGPLCGVMAEAFPKARLTLQDYSEAMLAQARERLGAHAARLRLVTADLMSPAWTGEFGGPFHAIVSSMCLHNFQFDTTSRI